MLDIEKIESQGSLLAMVIRGAPSHNGAQFLTDPSDEQQVAYMKHPSGAIIQPHYHNAVQRVISRTQEVLIVTRGKLECQLFDHNNKHVRNCVLEAGELIVLVAGGHGFTALEEVEMIEVKQGPFLGDCDKVRFTYEVQGGDLLA
jgi:hypothetical protein